MFKGVPMKKHLISCHFLAIIVLIMLINSCAEDKTCADACDNTWLVYLKSDDVIPYKNAYLTNCTLECEEEKIQEVINCTASADSMEDIEECGGRFPEIVKRYEDFYNRMQQNRQNLESVQQRVHSTLSNQP